MADIDERIAEFLNEKFASESATPSLMERIALRLSSEVVALVALIERAVVRLKDLLTYRTAVAASPARSALRQELADHMRDAYDHQLELGRDPEAAWDYVKGHFGD